ncbi:Fic family protein [Levilactobacillus andaensis]|uniref:Fic family protein n=1 Tax=Levilactobacillus andaensis TaxID=2799570 RepID=UPI00194161B3|nr:Fic family protein [Levilactobacillus andaensis]
MSFPDKFQLTTITEQNLIQQNLAQLIYTTGKFENLSTSLTDTICILNNEPAPAATPRDIATIISLNHAFQSILAQKLPLIYPDIFVLNQDINNSRPSSGQLRTNDVTVALTNDVWLPPLPDPQRTPRELTNILTGSTTTTEKALNLNLYLSRWQLFMDGNKRTAIVAANALMIQAGAGLLAIPENKMHWYRSQLQKYYRSGRDASLKQWLYDNCVFGIAEN